MATLLIRFAVTGIVASLAVFLGANEAVAVLIGFAAGLAFEWAADR